MQQNKQLELQRAQLAQQGAYQQGSLQLQRERIAAVGARATDNLTRVKSALAQKATTQAAKDWSDPLKALELKKQYPSQKAYQKELFEDMWSQSMPLTYAGVQASEED